MHITCSEAHQNTHRYRRHMEHTLRPNRETYTSWASPVAQLVKKNRHPPPRPANAGDTRASDSITGLGRSPGEGNGNLLQYSCLENSMDRGAWQATILGIAKSRTRMGTHACRGVGEYTNTYLDTLPKLTQRLTFRHVRSHMCKNTLGTQILSCTHV